MVKADLNQLLGKQPQAVLFDLDGTLINSVKDIHFALNQTLSPFAQSTEQQVAQWIGNGSLKLVERALTYFDLMQADRLQQMHHDFLLAYQQTKFQFTQVYDGSWDLLQRLKNHDIACAIVTNKPQQLLPDLLTQMGLIDYFDIVVGGSSQLAAKPAPDMLIWVVDQLNLQVENCVMIGDSSNDIFAAKACAMKSIAVTYGYHQGDSKALLEADVCINDLTEIDVGASGE